MKKFILLIIPVFILSSCKTFVPFTNQLKVENKWQEQDLKSIQYYTSNTIVLHRQLNNSATEIVSGKIKTVDGKKVEEVVIKKGTPGVVVSFPDKKRMAISFEIDDGHYLTFGSYQKRGGRYYLTLRDYKKNKWSKVSYLNQEYFLTNESLRAFLQVDMRKIQKEDIKQRVAGGRKL